MTGASAPASPEAVRGWCDRAGMRPDSPLRAALLATMEAATAAREAAGGARGLPPEAERELVRRVAEAIAAGAEREMARLSRRVELRTALALAGLLLLGGSYALGRWDATARAEAPRGAGFLAQVAELNDLAVLRRHCERNAYDHAGRRACTLPPVWIGGTR
ncbi:hypothetical protein [Roseicella aquatilis]|uniref:DUF3619 family protein n=1 Tax=Roseicella aquatilis TaxID=2527868 RepID=A0A4R4D3F5_9PROT|nr:hypothetical protein [Roseicella aquatilis]TCZ51449.1 hypothetical protein EXY23_26925 [Roseicella aquatilis]